MRTADPNRARRGSLSPASPADSPVGEGPLHPEGDPDNILATLTVAIKDANAGAAIAQANQSNDAARAGYHYVAVEYTFAALSKTEPANVSMFLGDW